MVVSIYTILNERNVRFHKSSPKSLLALAYIIRSSVAHKLQRWKFKDSWPESAASFFGIFMTFFSLPGAIGCRVLDNEELDAAPVVLGVPLLAGLSHGDCCFVGSFIGCFVLLLHRLLCSLWVGGYSTTMLYDLYVSCLHHPVQYFGFVLFALYGSSTCLVSMAVFL